MKADIWSCGVILFALVSGKLPFDDDNIRRLLAKVKAGLFTMPAYLHKDVQDLINRMLTVNPEERISMAEIKKHPWYTSKNMLRCKKTPPIPRVRRLLSRSGLDVARTDPQRSPRRRWNPRQMTRLSPHSKPSGTARRARSRSSSKIPPGTGTSSIWRGRFRLTMLPATTAKPSTTFFTRGSWS